MQQLGGATTLLADKTKLSDALRDRTPGTRTDRYFSQKSPVSLLNDNNEEIWSMISDENDRDGSIEKQKVYECIRICR